MTTARSYDRLNRLMGISSIPAGANQLPLSFQYSYNDANQRIRVGLHDGSYWLYEYDALGQVQSGKRYWADGTPVSGQQFEYSHDDIGNRTETKAGGDSTGGNLRTAEYGANSLNQYTNQAVPGYVDVLGIGTAVAAVTVNGTGAYRRGEYFHVALAVDNSSAAQYPSIVIQAVAGANSASSTGRVFLAKTPETFVHDADGNLIQDGHWTYTWDGENRLVAMEALSTVPSAAKLRVEFEYDWQGRRIGKTVKAWSGSTYTNVYILKFLYDGWNLVAEVDTNNNVVRSYLWGTDLSGSFQGAGGVRGLLAVNVATNGVHFPASDGNGNIAGLVSASTGAVTARFEYGPFAEPIRVSGPIAKTMPLRFSTKYLDDETGLYYYGYRYYDPGTGRWLNRDPIGEYGGLNLYAPVGNDPLDQTDPFGLAFGNPVSGPSGMWPSDPYSPGGVYYVRQSYVRLPSGPTLGQQLFGGPDSPEVDQTAWFNLHYPGWSSYAQYYYTELIEKKIQNNCGKKYVTNLPRLPVYPYYSDTFLSTRTAADMGGADETRFGDQPQSRFSADKVLGSFLYKLDGLATISYSDSLLLCCKRYTWRADVVIYDVLGFQPGDPGYYISFGLAPERGLIRARWTITGSGICCKK